MASGRQPVIPVAIAAIALDGLAMVEETDVDRFL
jgi:hypothetical protein